MDISFLQHCLQQPLPGSASHLKMAPAHRMAEFEGIRDKDFNPRLSAVLVVLFHEEENAALNATPMDALNHDGTLKAKQTDALNHSGTLNAKQTDIPNGLKVVFIRRGEYVGIHSGQIAFPGGRYEESDGDLRETAMREVEEELGIPRDSYEIIGQLTDLYVPPSNFLVRAYVAYTHQRPSYQPDAREVQEVIEVDMAHFFNNNNVKVKDFPAHNSVNNTSAPYYDVDGVVIWGATAMMLRELLDTMIND